MIHLSKTAILGALLAVSLRFASAIPFTGNIATSGAGTFTCTAAPSCTFTFTGAATPSFQNS